MKNINQLNTSLVTVSGGGGKTKPPKEGEVIPKQEPVKKEYKKEKKG